MTAISAKVIIDMPANNKTYKIVVEFKINRAVWRSLSFGDQPSKSEITSLLRSFIQERAKPGTYPNITLRYMGAPGHYKATSSVTIDQPWWRRAGFGDKVSIEEVKIQFEDYLRRIADSFFASVSLEN